MHWLDNYTKSAKGLEKVRGRRGGISIASALSDWNGLESPLRKGRGKK